jgi:predicted DNA-binding transcriptional regulator YafY
MYNYQAKLEFIDNLLSGRLSYSRKAISTRFEVHFGQPLVERTFFEYLKKLKREAAPIQKKRLGKETLYEYSRDFSLTKNPLKSKDAQKLKQILKVLNQMKGLPQIEDLRAIVMTLEQQTNLKSGDTQQILFLDHKPMSKRTDLLEPLLQHIEKKEVIEILYRPFYLSDDKPALKIYLHPYFLKEYERYWHLFGLNDTTKTIQNFPIDRIQNVSIPNGRLFVNPKVDTTNYFEHMIGVTGYDNSQIEVYKIRVHSAIAGHWKNRPLHGSQIPIQEEAKHTIFEFKLRWNYEWQNKILHYGKNVEVLEPIAFRKSIQTILKEALSLYDEPPIE